jgi:hypothetical protein
MLRSFSSSRLYTGVTNWLFNHDQLVIRTLVLLGVLASSVLVAPRAATGSRMFMMLILLLIGIGPVLLFLYKPMIGILLLIPSALYVPLNIGTGTGTNLSAPVLLIILLLALWMLDMVVRRKKITFISSRPFLPLFVLLVIAFLAFAMGQLPWFLYAKQASIAAQIGGLSVFFLSAAAFSLAAHQITDLRWLRYMTWVFLALGGLYIFGRLFPALEITRFFQWGAHGSLFWTWIVALASSQALFNASLKPHWRVILGGLAAATLAVGWFQARDWASGWVPGVAVVGALIWLFNWRLGLLATVLAVLMKVVFDPGLFNQLLRADAYSISTRWVAWEIVIREIVSVNPLMGLGPANYYHYTSLFPILGWYVVFNSHSQYVDLLAQTGILGFLCFFWFIWEVGRLGWRLRLKVPEGFAQAYVNGALAGLVGMLVAGALGDWILPFVYNIGLVGFRASMFGWLFLGALIAIDRMYVEDHSIAFPPIQTS